MLNHELSEFVDSNGYAGWSFLCQVIIVSVLTNVPVLPCCSSLCML